jgi:hypothetical protein
MEGVSSISSLRRTWLHLVVATHSSRPDQLRWLWMHHVTHVPYIDRPLAKDILVQRNCQQSLVRMHGCNALMRMHRDLCAKDSLVVAA